MTVRSGFAEVPQPLRWASVGAVLLAVLGTTYGFIESIRDYPLSSWFGVTLYVTMLASTAGFILGFLAGVTQRLFRATKAR